ncbi:semaphorin-4E-like [Archocentrus centrarchus]|uniref:semaphorin-4E-like n=1 Tax=Archocentrus centrarchus TaxID=63155 RepID=UPI0011E9BDF9|nr:semaphorin-4E-like [Archocentrus centrarchus]
MNPLLSLTVFWLLPLALMAKEDLPLDCIPRRSVPYHRDNARFFHEEGVYNYSTMLLREDEGVLVLGAREELYALDLQDISQKRASVKWEATKKKKDECKSKGKNAETECLNYIRILHKLEDGRMYVCGTNAFDPECNYMSFASQKLTLENVEDGKGKCPFDPFQRYASIMTGNELYSATSVNFLGSEPVLMRSSPGPIRTEFKSSWLNEPTFVSMAQMPESERSDSGDDDKVYLFFSETAVECDCYNKLVVSRVARVCKGDRGGQRTLQRKWTSFLKARIDCPVQESQLPYIIRDAYRWCDPKQDWKGCIFYTIFTPQSDTSDLSAVCAYHVLDISRVFAEGKYKTPVPVETSFVKWVMYSGEVPIPRPGACINNAARNVGINKTLDLPDRTLQFIKDKPLMDQVIHPIGDKPLLVRRGAAFIQIIVNQVKAADGENYHVMFIGTDKGTVLKAVNYDGEMFIVEEIQVFHPPVPIKILKLSNVMIQDVQGQLYAGSDTGVAQIPVATCERSSSCVDCVLARDPYCGWNKILGKCVFISNSHSEVIQSVKVGNASLCPDADPIKPQNKSVQQGAVLKLSCLPPSSLAKIMWQQNDQALIPSDHLQLQQDGLLIHNTSFSDAGHYRCMSVESSRADKYKTTLLEYWVTISGSGKSGPILGPQAQTGCISDIALQAIVWLLAVSLLVLLGWNFYKGHLPLPWNCLKRNSEEPQRNQEEALNSRTSYQVVQIAAPAEEKPLVSGTDSSSTSNNNHTLSAAAEHNAPKSALLQSTNNESEI